MSTTFCQSCGCITMLLIGRGETICLGCLEMLESTQDHHDLTHASMYLAHHPDLLEDLTPPERAEIARHMRSTQAQEAEGV